MTLGAIAFAVPFIWIAAVISISVLNRLRLGKPIFPRVPSSAIFSEAWTSGRSLKGVISRIGGARNCLLVYVADGTLAVVPVFPLNLMLLPEIYGLEFSAPISKINVEQLDGILGKRLRISFKDSTQETIELSLRNPLRFQEAIAARRKVVGDPTGALNAREHKASWRRGFFRVFAIIWGLGVLATTTGELRSDLHYRRDGKVTIATMVGHTGPVGSKNDSGILRYFVEGRPYRIVSLQGSGVYTIGSTTRVRYLADDPARGREDSHLAFDIFFIVAGICVLTLGLTLGRIKRLFENRMNV